MISKRAFEFINNKNKHIRNICLDFINPEDAKEALNILSVDLRLYAVNVFCKNCERDNNGCADTGEMNGNCNCDACIMYLDTYDDNFCYTKNI